MGIGTPISHNRLPVSMPSSLVRWGNYAHHRPFR